MLSAAPGAPPAGVPFAAVPVHLGTGYLTGGWSDGMLAQLDIPYGTATIVRALPVDVAFVHASLAAPAGSCWFGAPAGEASSRRRRPAAWSWSPSRSGRRPRRARGIDLPGLAVDQVVEVPGAVRPDGVPGHYPRDVAAYQAYARAGGVA